VRVAVLPTYTAEPGAPWQAELQAGEQTHVLRWPRGAQDAAWAQGVLANRLVAAVTLPAGINGPLRLRAGQRDLMFDGAELQPGPCP